MYKLKLYDETLIEFDMEMNFKLEISNINIITKNKILLPEMLQDNLNAKGIEDFLKNRTIPKNRAFVKSILEAQGLNLNNTKGIIDISKGLSLNDCYWIVQDDNLKFKDFNLYDNNFSEVLSLIAFTGYNSKIKGIATSPEYTTNGVLPKAWRRIDGNIYLFKGSTEDLKVSNSGFEPYSEYYSSQIAKIMGLKNIDYDLEKWKGYLASVCPLFTTKEISYVPIYLASKADNIEDIANWCKEQGFENDFSDLILFDSLIINPDRHLANFGVLKDSRTGDYLGLAPIFDNGEGLFSKADINIFKNKELFEKYVKQEDINTSNYGIDYRKLVNRYCIKDQVSKLNKLSNFEFTRHEKYNLDETRLKLIENFIKSRARELIFILETVENKKPLLYNLNNEKYEVKIFKTKQEYNENKPSVLKEFKDRFLAIEYLNQNMQEKYYYSEVLDTNLNNIIIYKLGKEFGKEISAPKSMVWEDENNFINSSGQLEKERLSLLTKDDFENILDDIKYNIKHNVDFNLSKQEILNQINNEVEIYVNNFFGKEEEHYKNELFEGILDNLNLNKLLKENEDEESL